MRFTNISLFNKIKVFWQGNAAPDRPFKKPVFF